MDSRSFAYVGEDLGTLGQRCLIVLRCHCLAIPLKLSRKKRGFESVYTGCPGQDRGGVSIPFWGVRTMSSGRLGRRSLGNGGWRGKLDERAGSLKTSSLVRD
jgi:hypothetical protein